MPCRLAGRVRGRGWRGRGGAPGGQGEADEEGRATRDSVRRRRDGGRGGGRALTVSIRRRGVWSSRARGGRGGRGGGGRSEAGLHWRFTYVACVSRGRSSSGGGIYSSSTRRSLSSDCHGRTSAFVPSDCGRLRRDEFRISGFLRLAAPG